VADPDTRDEAHRIDVVKPAGVPRLSLNGARGEELIALSIGPAFGDAWLRLDGGPGTGIQLRHDDGRTRAGLELGADESGAVVFFDEAGHAVWRAP
jgi:hypothetical protein